VDGVSKPWRLVLLGGLVAGASDIVYACVFWAIKRGVAPQRILQRVASGVLGEASLTGGWATAALGLALHFFIAISMAVAFYLVARRWAALWQRPVVFGALYGLLLYCIMNYVVVPLSAARPGSSDALWIGMSIAVHMLLVGLPCALFARRAILEEIRAPVASDRVFLRH
jgi:uncharacterized membrane protein YagU involved in acid resistance